VALMGVWDQAADLVGIPADTSNTKQGHMSARL
jgi:hypothetical protein